MDETMTSIADGRMRALRTYLRDHTGGAGGATELLRALGAHYGGTPFGTFAASQVKEVEEDLRVLEDLARRVGGEGFQVKELAGWLGEKLGRLKLTPLEDPFHTFEALEFLSLGILGKRALWRTLGIVAPSIAELQGVDFAALLERAEAQYAAMEAMRLRIGARVFGGEGAGGDA